MASNKIKGLTVEIGGDTTKLGKALESVDKKTKSLSSELGEINRLLKLDPSNTELLSQKQKVLAEAIDNTGNKLDTLRQAEKQVQEQFERGEVSEDQYRALQREIVATENKLESYARAARETADAIDELGKESKETLQETADLKNKLADVASKGLMGIGAGVTAAAGALTAAAESTREYRTEMGKLETAFTTSGHSAETAEATYKTLQGVLGDSDQAVEASNHLAKLCKNEDDLAKMTNAATGIYATFGASLPIEGLTEAANETAKTGAITGGLADALNWAGVSEDEFQEKLDKCSSEQERQKLIIDTLNSLYSDAADQYRETNAEVIAANEANEAMTSSTAKIGEVIEPVLSRVKEMAAALLEKLVPVIEAILDNLPAVAIALGGAAAAVAAFKIAAIAATAAAKGMTLAQYAMAAAQKVLNVVMSANPIGLIILAITALVAAFVVLWKNCEGFRNFWINLWENVKIAFQAFMEWASPAFEVIKGFFVSLWAKIQEVWAYITASLEPIKTAMVGAFQAAWDLIQVIWSAVLPYFQVAWDGIKNVWAAAQPFFSTLWNSIKQVFSVVATYLGGAFRTAWTLIKAVWDTVTGYFRAVWNTIAGVFSVVKSVLTGDFKGAWEGIKGIVSTWAGFFRGVWGSIKAVFASVKSWFGDTFRAAWAAVKNVFADWGSFFSGLWGKIKSTFSKLGTNIASAIGGAVKSGINGVISMIERTINSAIGLINGAITLVNKIPGVSVGKVSKLSLPRLARGGIVDRPTTAVIGEDGREAVIPLENNTGWLREVAQMLNSYQNTDDNTAALLDKLDGIYDRLNRMQIVLDTGTLVGETIDKIDKGLGARQLLSARGV